MALETGPPSHKVRRLIHFFRFTLHAQKVKDCLDAEATCWRRPPEMLVRSFGSKLKRKNAGYCPVEARKNEKEVWPDDLPPYAGNRPNPMLDLQQRSFNNEIQCSVSLIEFEDWFFFYFDRHGPGGAKVSQTPADCFSCLLKGPRRRVLGAIGFSLIAERSFLTHSSPHIK